jgi:hypothetical protein
VAGTVAGMAMLVCAAWATAALAAVHVSVTPVSGAPTTRFVVGFRAPNTTGVFASGSSHYVVSATAPAAHGCAASVSVGVPPTTRGARVRVTLKPGAHHPWCAERFHGRIVEIVSLGCHPQITACPALEPALTVPEPAPLTVALFSFRVRP